MVRIYVGEAWSEIEGLPSSLNLRLDAALSAPVDGYYFARKHTPGWDGKIHLFRGGKFPTGLLGVVVNILKAANLPFHVVELRRSVPFRKEEFSILRDYQRKALEKALYLRTGIIHHPTGSGKTLIIAGLFKCFADRPKIYLAHRLDLVVQTQARLKEFGVIGDSVDILINGRTDIRSNTIFSTFQTCRKLLNHPEGIQFLSQLDLMCVDEVHTLPADTFFRLAMRINAPYRIGFSATPLHDNPARNLKLIGAIGPIIDAVESKELIEQGHLAKPCILFVDLPIPEIEPLFGDYNTHYELALAQCEERNRAIVTLAQKCVECGNKVMILVKRIKHGMLLAQMLGAQFLSGIDDISRRRRAVQDFEEGRTKILLASTIFDEGVDIRKVSTLIIASGGASSLRALQRAGRGLRPAPGKSKVYIIDFTDKHNSYLRRHANRRLKAYKQVYDDVRKVSLEEAIDEICKPD